MLRPCRHRLPGDLVDAWIAHLCGLCLALRDGHGHAARLVTNTDAVAISALVEAQTGTGEGRRRDVGPCALRGMRRASVAQGEAAALAATVSLTLVAAKLEDHVADGDTSHRLVAAGARAVAGRAARAAGNDGDAIGFASGDVLASVRRQAALEGAATATTPLLDLTAPTEDATSAAFAHTAVIADQPANTLSLAEVGRVFGRLAHLLDAVEDLEDDRAAGRFNPIDVTGTSLDDVRALCNDAVLGIKMALQDATFVDRRLVHRLLVHETEHAVDRAFGTHGHGHPTDGSPWPPPNQPPVVPVAPGPAVPLAPGEPDPYAPAPPPAGPFPPPGQHRNNLLSGCVAAIGLCCTGQLCCSKEYRNPFNGEPHEGCMRKCDGCCDCADCSCDCCDCGCDCC